MQATLNVVNQARALLRRDRSPEARAYQRELAEIRIRLDSGEELTGSQVWLVDYLNFVA